MNYKAQMVHRVVEDDDTMLIVMTVTATSKRFAQEDLEDDDAITRMAGLLLSKVTGVVPVAPDDHEVSVELDEALPPLEPVVLTGRPTEGGKLENLLTHPETWGGGQSQS